MQTSWVVNEKGYEEHLVDKQIERARKVDRETLINNSGSNTTNHLRDENVVLVTTYNPALSNLGKASGDFILCSKVRRSTGWYLQSYHLFHLGGVRISMIY